MSLPFISLSPQKKATRIPDDQSLIGYRRLSNCKYGGDGAPTIRGVTQGLVYLARCLN